MLTVFLLALVLISFGSASTPQSPSTEAASQTFSAARLFQRRFCSRPTKYADAALNSRTRQTTVLFSGTVFPMYVYSDKDEVSASILRYGEWEGESTNIFFGAVDHYVRSKSIRDRKSLTFLDIGAHVGWYALGMAAKGFRVIGFEPMKENLYVLRKSICLNPSMDITIIDQALGEQRETCRLYAHKENLGDPALYCGNNFATNADYVQVGLVEIYQLDQFAELMGNVVAVKMDIEGFEHKAVRGGRKVLLDMHIPIIMTEFCPLMMRSQGGNPREFLEEFVRAGYDIGLRGFVAPFPTVDEVIVSAERDININIYLIHRSAQS